MVKISVMYPHKPGARFDFDYYRNTHMRLVAEHEGPHGLLRTTVERGLPGADGSPPPFVCIGALYFNSIQEYTGIPEATAARLRADVSNYTDITPVRQFSELLDA